MTQQGRRGRKGAKARVQVAAKSVRVELYVVLLVATLLAMAFLTRTAHGAPAEARALEVKVWTADENELPLIEREVTRLIQKDPRSAFAHHLLSHTLVRFFSKDPGDLYLLKQASDLAQQAIDLEPRNGVGYVALADILDLMGNPDRAVRLLDEAEAAGVEPNWRFYFTRARLLSDEAGGKRVLGLLETALGFVDAQPTIIVPYVVALLQAEAQGEPLVAKLTDWNRRYPSPLFDLTAAITLTELGQFQRAHELYGKIIKTHPENKEARVNDAILLYRDLKDGAGASVTLEKVLADHGKDMPSGVRAMVTAHLGAAYLVRKNYDKAGTEFTRAMEADPDNLGVLDFMTRTYRAHKAHEQLATLIRSLTQRIGGTGVLHALLGETLSENLNRHDDAIKAFTDAITLDPDRSDYYNGMGLTYYRQKIYPQALKLFMTATEIDPNDATARYNEACVLSLMGRKEDAINTLAEALTLDPRLTQNARGDSDFSTIKDSIKFRQLVQEPVKLPEPFGGTAVGH